MAARAATASARAAMPAHTARQTGAEAGGTLVRELDKVEGRRTATITEAGGNEPGAAA